MSDHADEIDHESATPLYVQIADIIERKIKSGELKPDRPIPAEVRMAEEYGVARLTARRAVRELRERGLVITVPGRGTFVNPRIEEGADDDGRDDAG